MANLDDEQQNIYDKNGGGGSGNWATWSQYVIKSIQGLNDEIADLRKDHYEFKSEARTNIAVLQTKAAIYGAIAGAVVGIITTVVSGLTLYYVTSSAITTNPAIDNNQKQQKKESLLKNKNQYKPALYEYIELEARRNATQQKS